jgi:hypothetical protein
MTALIVFIAAAQALGWPEVSGLWAAGALVILTACLVGTIFLAARESKRANRDGDVK